MQKVSVITVVYNGFDTIERTISSVLKQSYSNIEYIIIDGKSTDGTLEIINKYRNKINTVISESDSGIYDAMNKGIRYSTGDLILFLNSDDYLLYSDAINDEVTLLEETKSDYAYAKAKFIDVDGKEYINPTQSNPNLSKLFLEMPCCHQTIMCKREFFDNNLFNENYKSAADYDWFIKINLRGAKGAYLNRETVMFTGGGTSQKISLLKLSRHEIANSFWRNINSIYSDFSKEDAWNLLNYYYLEEKVFSIIQNYLCFSIERPNIIDNNKNADKIERQNVIISCLERYINNLKMGVGFAKKLSDRNIKKVVVYGCGRLGKMLLEDLKDSGVEVARVVDKNPETCTVSNVSSICEIYGTDIHIIITAVYDYLEIKEYLKSKGCSNIISLEELL